MLTSPHHRPVPADPTTLVSLAQVQQARSELPPQVIRTPMLVSDGLSARAGATVYLKPENLQITGSYKVRAAYTILNRLSPEQKRRGAALSSSGNFAGAWGYMGRLLGVPVAVVAQEHTAPIKLEKARNWGAEVVLCANSFDARWETLSALERERGILAINNYEHPDVIIGHGTIGLEIVEDVPDVDTVLVPVSSGGLLAGVATAVKALRPSARVVGVQPEGSNAVYTSFKAGEVRRIAKVNSICDALVAAQPGTVPFAHITRSVDDMVLVSDDETKAAVRWLAESAKLTVEAGGAVSAAAVLAGKVRLQGPAVVLLSGGNIAPATLAAYLLEGPPVPARLP